MTEQAAQAPPKASTVDILALPGIRGIRTKWRTLILANKAVRREAKAVLFAELSKALAHGMPLHAALAANSRSLGESRRSTALGVSRGADTRNRVIHLLIGIGNIFAQLNGMLYLLLAFRYADIERVARRLAMRLQEDAEKGLPLSVCMGNHPHDFSEQEVSIAAAGEQWGRLPSALQSLSEFQVTERQLSTQGANVLYPFVIGYLCMGILSFIMIFILPKFKDIFDQLHAELPALTMRLVDFAYWGSGAIAGGLISSGVAIVNFFLLRALMNGSRLSLFLLSLIFIGVIGGFSLGAMSEVMSSRTLSDNQTLLVILAIPVCFAIILLGLPYVMAALEFVVLQVESVFEPMLRMMPFVGGAAQVEREARWLAALSVALGAGVPAAEAVRTAGRISGDYYTSLSDQAALVVEQGHSIGEAAVQTQLLKPKMNHRLRLLDASPDFLRGLSAIADDASQEAIQRMNRAGRITEVLAIVLMAVTITFVLIALYMPLFAIPRIVGV